VVSDLLKGWSLLAVIAEDAQDQVLELRGKTFSANFLPVVLSFALAEEVVEVLVFLGLFEREDSLDDDEQDNTS